MQLQNTLAITAAHLSLQGLGLKSTQLSRNSQGRCVPALSYSVSCWAGGSLFRLCLVVSSEAQRKPSRRIAAESIGPIVVIMDKLQ